MAKRSLEVSLPMEMVLRLKQLATLKGETASDIVKTALLEYAAKRGWRLESEKREVSQ